MPPVELNGKDLFPCIRKPLIRPIVYILKSRNCHRRIQTFGVYYIAVIL